MSELIVLLPTSPSNVATVYRYVETRDGQTVATHGSAPATALPLVSGGQDVVAIIPARALSWHQVELPKGTLSSGATRLRAVLDGLLEDRMLDEPQNLHLAVEPHPSAGAPVWVAACDKAWLEAALAALEAAGRPVSRIVPEFCPSPSATEEGLYALGETDDAWLVHTDVSGVTVLPLQATVAAQAVSRSRFAAGQSDEIGVHVFAEPGVAALANQLFNNRVTLQQAHERWVMSVQSPWDLAQFGLANSGRQRFYKKLSSAWLDGVHAPRWRAARWGLLLIIAANLIGLNAWAWKEKAALRAQRSAIQSVLTETFSQVKVVVDAPVQMERELALLKQAAGTASRQDLENLLTLVGSTMLPTESLNLTQIDYVEGELRLKGAGAEDTKAQDLQNRLSGQGYVVRMDGDSLVVKLQAETRP